MDNHVDRPLVGVAAIVIRGDKVLMGKRIGAHGAGSYHFPGGHLEYGESWEDCVIRETREEAGIEIKNIKFAAVTNDIFEQERKHYITIFMTAELASGEPRIMEPEKCEGWDWYGWNELPRPLFLAVESLVKQGYDPFGDKE